MSQHGRFEQDYLRMKVQIDKLKASGLSEEQRTIFSKLDKMIQHFEHHLFTEYIDFEEICDNLPRMALYLRIRKQQLHWLWIFSRLQRHPLNCR